LNEFDWTHWYRVKYFTVAEENRGKNIKAKAILNRRLNKFKDMSKDVLADIIGDNRGKNIVLFTHGNFIKSILAGIMDSDIFGFLSLEVFQSSITKIMIDRDNNVIISYINDVNHLPQKPVEDAFLTVVK
jgi:broad specificity phosphatase PhoE